MIVIEKFCVKFNIWTNPTFEWVKLDAHEIINQCISTTFGMDVQKSNVLFLIVERNMLNHDKCQVTFPHNINLWFGYFCTKNFVIRGAFEIYIVDNHDFLLHIDEFETYLRYYIWCLVYFSFIFLDCLIVLIFFVLFFNFMSIKKVFQRTITLMLVTML